MRGSVCVCVCAHAREWVCGLRWKGALRRTSELNAIVLTSRDASKRGGITQSSPLKIPRQVLDWGRDQLRLRSAHWRRVPRLGGPIETRLLRQMLCNRVFKKALSASLHLFIAKARPETADKPPAASPRRLHPPWGENRTITRFPRPPPRCFTSRLTSAI